MENNLIFHTSSDYQTFEKTTNNTDYTDWDYDYEYDDSISAIPLAELLPVSTVYGLTLIIGLVGNSLVIAAIVINKRMRSVTNIFLTSLASANLLLVLVCVPIKFAKFITFSWTFGAPLCKLVHYLQNVSVICSILTMTAMSMERYYAIVHPMKAKFLCTNGRARTISIVIWFIAFLLACPILIGQIHKAVGWRRPAFWCVKEWDFPIYSKLYETGMLLLIFVIPLVIVSFAYINICKELCKMSAVRNTMRLNSGKPCKKRYGHKTKAEAQQVCVQSSDDTQQRRQVIKMLVTIICLFTICWGPILIDNVISAYAPHLVDPYNYGHLKYMRQAFFLMAYFNSCVNPIVYAFMSKNFRQGFQRTLKACCHRRSSHTMFMRRSIDNYMTGKNESNLMSAQRYLSQNVTKSEYCPDSIASQHKELLSNEDNFENSNM